MTTPTPIQHGSATWWVLQALTNFGPMSEGEIKNLGTHETPEALATVRNLHMISKNHIGQYELMPKGRSALAAAARRLHKAQITSKAQSRSIVNTSSKDPYDAPELKPYDGRPGAMDAFKLPSRYGDRLLHYRTGEAIA